MPWCGLLKHLFREKRKKWGEWEGQSVVDSYIQSHSHGHFTFGQKLQVNSIHLEKHDIKNMMRMLIKHDPSHDTQGAVHDSDVTKLNCFSSEFDRLTLRSISWHAAGGFLARFWNWACSVRHVAWQA